MEHSQFTTYKIDNGQTSLAAGNDYVLSAGTTNRTPQKPTITTDLQQSSPISPSPRLRVAFNRETNFVLEPARQQQMQTPEQMQAIHTPEAQMAEICNPEFETPSPKSTLFDLKYQKPGLYRENSDSMAKPLKDGTLLDRFRGDKRVRSEGGHLRRLS